MILDHPALQAPHQGIQESERRKINVKKGKK